MPGGSDATLRKPHNEFTFLICVQNVNMFIKLTISASKAGSCDLWKNRELETTSRLQLTPDGTQTGEQLHILSLADTFIA